MAIGDGSEPIPNGTVVIRDGRIVAAGDMRMKLPAGAQVIDAQRQMGDARASSPASRGSAWPRSTSRADGAQRHPAARRPVQRGDRRRPGDQSARHDRSPSTAPAASPARWSRRQAGKSIFAGQGAVIDIGADMDPITAAAALPVRRAGRDRRATRPADRAPRPMSCSATRCARRASWAAIAAPIAGCAAATPRRARTPGDPQSQRIAALRPDARRSDDVLLTRFDAAALVPVLQGRQ